MSFSSVFREIYSLAPSRRIVFQLLKYMTLCIFAIFFLLFMVSFLPQNPLRNNIIQASNEGYFDDNYPSPGYLFIFDNRIDMYTECVGIGASAQLEPNLYSILSMKFFENCPDLKNGINNNFTGIYSYYRYIHGYQIVLKSLYTYFKIKNVRICIFLVTAILLCIMFIVLGKNITVNYSLVILLSFFITKSSDVFIIAT
ncbi:MAG: hypothetical protein J5838_06575, partial [Desulfovibrio sp.]|nr:hypothetical protein [Desulfovibrio sp.]